MTIENLLPGVYTVTEQSVPEGYILDTTPQQVTLEPNRDATVQFQNYKRPSTDHPQGGHQRQRPDGGDLSR